MFYLLAAVLWFAVLLITFLVINGVSYWLDARKRRQQSYRRWRGAALLLLPLLMLAGCANSSLQRCYQSKQTYATTLEAVADLRDQGIVSQAQVTASKPYRVAARLALDGWEQAARAGDVGVANTYEEKFQAAAAVLQRLIDSYAPTTRPTGATHGSSGSFDGGAIHLATGGGGVGSESPDYLRRVGDGQRPHRGGRLAA